MKKLATVLGIAVLTTATGLAIAGGQFCQDRGGERAADAPYSQQYSHQFKHERHHGFKGQFGGHHKVCDFKKGSQERANMSPEKRQAISQLKIENRLERMTQKYHLSTDQQSQLRSILQEKQQKMQELKAQYRDKVDSVLTNEQKQQREQSRQQHRANMHSASEVQTPA